VAVTVPLQKPAHAEPSPAHAARGSTGCPLTGVHAPTLPPRLHASHWPEQALSQHTPSAHWAVVHWFPAVHAVPGVPFGTQLPLLQ